MTRRHVRDRKRYSPPRVDPAPVRAVTPTCPAFPALFRPLLLAHLVLSPLAFSVDTADPFEFVKVHLTMLMTLVMAGLAASAFISGAIRLHRSQPRPGPDLITVGILLYAGSAVVSTVVSISPRTSVWGARESFAGLVTVLGYVGVYFAARHSFPNPGGVRSVSSAAVVGTAGLGAYALVQAFGADPVTWGAVSELGAVARPAAMMGHANHLGSYLVTALPLVAWAVMCQFAAGRRVSAGLITGVAVGSVVVILLTLSRGAWLGLVVTIFIMLAGVRSRLRWGGLHPLTAATGLCLAALAGVIPLLTTGFAAEAVSRLARFGNSPGRRLIWEAALELFAERPWTGQGLDTFRLAFQAHRGPAFALAEPGYVAHRAHNELLQVLATQGVFGGLALAVLLAGVITGLVRAWRRGGGERAAAVVASAALGGFGTVSLVGFTSPGLGTLVFALTGVVSRLPEVPEVTDDGVGRWDWAGLVLGGSAAGACLIWNVATAAATVSAVGWLATAGVVALTGVAIAAGVSPGSTSPPVPAVVPTPASRGHGFGWSSAPLHALVWTGIGLTAWTLVIQPWSAELACAEGCQLLSTDPAAALCACRRAVEAAPTVEFYWQSLADAAESRARRGSPGQAAVRHWEAREALRRAITLEPRDAVNYIKLGRVLKNSSLAGEVLPAEAIEAFDRGLMIDRGCPEYYREAANAALDLNRPEDARRYAQRCLALFPRFGPAHAALGCLALQNREFSSAYALLTAAVANDVWDDRASWVTCYINLVEASFRVNDPEAAARFARQCLRTEPNLLALRLQLARAYEATRDFPAAEAEYRAVLDTAPGCRRAIAGVARLHPTAGIPLGGGQGNPCTAGEGVGAAPQMICPVRAESREVPLTVARPAPPPGLPP